MGVTTVTLHWKQSGDYGYVVKENGTVFTVIVEPTSHELTYTVGTTPVDLDVYEADGKGEATGRILAAVRLE